MVAGEGPGPVQAALFGGQLAEEAKGLQRHQQVVTDAAAGVRLREQLEVVVAQHDAEPDHQPPWVVRGRPVPRLLVDADQARHRLPGRHVDTGSPQQLAGDGGADPAVAAGRDAAALVGPGAGGLAHVVQQGGEQQDVPVRRLQGAPAALGHQPLGHHPGVDPHVPLPVVDGVLGAARQGRQDGQGGLDRPPVEDPVGGRGHRDHDAPPNRSTPSASRLGTIGRSSQWPSPSITACRKPGRTSL